jgi:diguanylate cyclase (GGDEF)-like protein
MPKRPKSKPSAAGRGRRDSGARGRRKAEENHALRAQLEFLKASQSRLEALSERVARIADITHELGSLDLDRIARVAIQRIPRLIRARFCSLYLYDYGANELSLLVHNHPTPISERISVGHHKDTVMGRALVSRDQVFITNFAEYERLHGISLKRAFPAKYSSQSCVCVPLQTANFLVGILNFADRDDGGPFDESQDLPPIEQVARVLAMAIRNCKLFKEVQNQAHTDALTRLGNYRAFHETLRSEMHRSSRYERPLALMMLDVDSFKEINDTRGHQAGDYALTELAKVVRQSVRREDFPARYGGDEIAIILPETKPRGAVMTVQRLMAAVRSHSFVFEGHPLTVTISVGVASFRPELTITQFVRAADEALYRAKAAGRNRHEVAGE